jgi:hypothetical protein
MYWTTFTARKDRPKIDPEKPGLAESEIRPRPIRKTTAGLTLSAPEAQPIASELSQVQKGFTKLRLLFYFIVFCKLIKQYVRCFACDFCGALRIESAVSLERDFSAGGPGSGCEEALGVIFQRCPDARPPRGSF